MPLDIMGAVDAAYEEFLRRPSAAHAALALGAQALFACGFMFLGFQPAHAIANGGYVAMGIWAGREFEQMAPHWKPGQRIAVSWKSARQAGYPALACGALALAAAAFYGQG